MKRTRLRPRSVDPRKVEREERIVEAGEAAKARDRYRCTAEGILPGPCGGPLDPQHVIPRSVRPDLADDVDNIVAVCRRHHDHIDAHNAVARELGYHGHSTDDLEELRRRRLAVREARRGWGN